MFADQTLTPREAVRLCALGTIAAGPRRYGDLAGSIRHFISRISGPSLDLLAPSIELLRYEGLVEPVDGKGMEDDAQLRITPAGQAEFRRLMVARMRPSSDLSKLVTALKFRFVHLLDEADRRLLLELLADTCETELSRLLDLKDGGTAAEGDFPAWLDLEITQAEARLEWVLRFR
ncbi:MAG: hypothetical protein H7840_06345 [Alphaproteobacteria bacterium]